MAKNKKYTTSYSSPSYKTLECCKCGENVKRVAVETTAVICWKCTLQSLKTT